MHRSISAIAMVATLWLPTISDAQVPPPGRKRLAVPLRVQETANWCWNASLQMIAKYRGRHFLEQCEIAKCAAFYGECCLEPHPRNPTDSTCDLAGVTEDIGFLFDNLNIPYTEKLGGTAYFNFSAAKTEIDNNNPFVIYWHYSDHGHYVVGSGYAVASGGLKDRLVINDPYPGEGVKTLDWDAVVTPSGGSWWYAWLTKAANTAKDKVTLYTDENLGGSSLTTASTTYVGDKMNDRTSSAMVRGVPYILYEDANYGGLAWSVNPGRYNSYFPIWYNQAMFQDEAISSVKSMPLASSENTVVLFEDENFAGASLSVTGSGVANLHNVNFGDRVSSMIVVNGIFQVFQHANYDGLPYAVTSFGGPHRDGFYPNAQSWGGPDNDISSVTWVPESTADHPIILYDGIDLTGRSVVLTPSSKAAWLTDFRNFGFDDKVSSIKTFGDSVWTVYTDLNGSGVAHQLSPNGWYRNWTYWGGNNDEITSISFNSGSGGWGF